MPAPCFRAGILSRQKSCVVVYGGCLSRRRDREYPNVQLTGQIKLHSMNAKSIDEGVTMTSSSPGGSATLPPLTKGPHSSRLGLISIVACLGGLLFGYDTGVINGALPSLTEEMGLTPISEGVVTSSLVFAAAIGAVSCGRISDAIGRRTTIIILAVLFFIGSVFVVTTPNIELLIVGRIFLGLGVGGASAVVPVFLAELAPFEIRGSITGRNELAIVSGQLAAFVINAIIGNVWGHVDGVWRIMFAVCAIPAIGLFFGMLRMPESPRWLLEKGRRDE